MGMGYSANVVNGVSEEFIKKVAKEEWEKFMAAIAADENYSFGDFAKDQQYEDTEDYSEEVKTSFKELCEVFNKKTGLELYIGYHNGEDGSCYDDVDGVYWYVKGAYQLTPAGEKYKEYIDKWYFVTFG